MTKTKGGEDIAKIVQPHYRWKVKNRDIRFDLTLFRFLKTIKKQKPIQRRKVINLCINL